MADRIMSTSAAAVNGHADADGPPRKKVKLHGRAFYESIGSPKMVLAPMVEQSEFTWRLLTRSFLPPTQQSALLAYTPMFHSKLFAEQKFRDAHFQPVKTTATSLPSDAKEAKHTPNPEHWLDGNPAFDRPLTVQFCSNSPNDLLNAARYVAPYCDAVDLNLGCPQGIAKRGNYGAFLQEDWPLISSMISKLHAELDVPVTAKMRVLETKEETLAYAKMILDAGASIITVHGRRREQKGHNTGLADWSFIRHLRDHLPPETVIFANGNILQAEDLARCLEETGADAVMSAEGNLYDPTIFAHPPPLGEEGREYWRGRDGRGGYRVDAVFRRYMDIIYAHALGRAPPARNLLFLPGDPEPAPPPPMPLKSQTARDDEETSRDSPPRKKHRPNPSDAKSRKQQRDASVKNPNLSPMQAHLFHLLRPLVSQHHNVRDALARCRVGDIESFENVLRLTEDAVREGLKAYEEDLRTKGGNEVEEGVASEDTPTTCSDVNIDAKVHTGIRPGLTGAETNEDTELPNPSSSAATIARCKRPFWVCQPYVRPLPEEAIAKGSMQVGKKEMKRRQTAAAVPAASAGQETAGTDAARLSSDATKLEDEQQEQEQQQQQHNAREDVTYLEQKDVVSAQDDVVAPREVQEELPKRGEGLVCG